MSSHNEKVFLKPYLFVLFVVLVFLALISWMIISNSQKVAETEAATASEASGSDHSSSEVDEITAPVGEVAVAAAAGSEDVVPAAEGDAGKATYDGVCFACHATDAIGAPMLGDKDAWAARIEQGNEALYDHAINGFTGPSGAMMPPKGGRADISDDDVKAAVDYMLEAVGESGSASTATEEAPAAEAAATTAAASSGGKGKEVYDATCFVCHATGVAGAPKLGDKEGWAARIAQGNDTLYDHAINGFMGTGMMPPKGGKADLSDDDVKAAVDYMVESGS